MVDSRPRDKATDGLMPFAAQVGADGGHLQEAHL